MRIAGRTESARERIEAEPWVTAITARLRGDQELWTVDVTDDRAAEQQLLSLLLADDGCDVTEFHRAERTLEDAYLEIVGADDGS